MNAQVHTAASAWRKGNPFILKYTFGVRIFTKYDSSLPPAHHANGKVTQQEVEKDQPLIINHTSCIRMLTKYESNLPTENK